MVTLFCLMKHLEALIILNLKANLVGLHILSSALNLQFSPLSIKIILLLRTGLQGTYTALRLVLKQLQKIMQFQLTSVNH